MNDTLALANTLWHKRVPAWARYAAYAAAFYYAKEAYASLTQKDLTGSVVLITGGGSGIGRLMAVKLAAQGCKIIIWDVNGEGAAATAAEISAAGGIAKAYVVDITNREHVYANAKRSAVEIGGEIDILLNNAGIVHGKSMLEASDATIERTFAVNVIAHCWLLKALLPGMIQRDRGVIVSLSSASGLVGVAKLGDYAASKWAAFGLNESIRMDLKRRGSKVKTLVVAPYYINTGMFEGVTTRFPWLLPILDPEHVSSAIIRAIKRGDETLMLPPIVGTVPLMRGLLPTSVFDAVTFFLGINHTMDDFRGRGPAGEEMLSPLAPSEAGVGASSRGVTSAGSTSSTTTASTSSRDAAASGNALGGGGGVAIAIPVPLPLVSVVSPPGASGAIPTVPM